MTSIRLSEQELLQSERHVEHQLSFRQIRSRRTRVVSAMPGVDDDARDAQSELAGD
jgi:hypothetical protein